MKTPRIMTRNEYHELQLSITLLNAWANVNYVLCIAATGEKYGAKAFTSLTIRPPSCSHIK